MNIQTGLPPEAKKGQPVALDLEMFGQDGEKLHRPHGTFACLSITLDGKTVYQIYDEHDVRKALKAVSKGMWVFHNALYDLKQLRRWAEIKPRFIWDTMLVEQSVYGGLYQYFSLADLVRRWMHRYMDKEVRESFNNAKEMNNKMKTYAATDAVVTWKISGMQWDEFTPELSYEAYKDIDEPMIFPVLDMPGMRVDVDAWSKAVKGFEKKATEIEGELGFNVKSTQQCHKALAGIGLHLSDTGADTLKLYDKKPLVAKIIEGRLYRDAVSKYGLAWLEKNVESDGYVYPAWHITGAKTGRMSSSHPNGQNIPQRKLPIYRTFFIPSVGNIMMISDAHQQEPCILAYMSKDRELIAAIVRKEDLHLTVARTVFHNPKLTKKDEDKRFIGKTINLGTSYGLSPYGLATRIGCTEQEAERFISTYFNRFPDVLNWSNVTKQSAYNLGYVTTASNRKLYINLHDGTWRNKSINAPIQGGAVDQMKLWVRNYWELCNEEGIPFNVSGIIHDEQVKDIPKGLRKKIQKMSDEAFERSAVQLFPGVPFTVENEFGKSWGAKSISTEAFEEEE